MALDSAYYEMFARATVSKTVVAVGIVSTAMLGGALNRIGAIFSPPVTNRYTLNNGAAAVLDQGITIHPLTIPFVFNSLNMGNNMNNAWNAIQNAVGENIGVWALLTPNT